MIKWFDDPAQRDRVARLVLLWVNNHFNDFETDARMGELMDKFETALQAEVRENTVDLCKFMQNYYRGWAAFKLF